MLKVFGILYIALNLAMVVIEAVRYWHRRDYMTLKGFIMYEATFVSHLLLSVDLYAICMGVLFGLVYLITGETVSL